MAQPATSAKHLLDGLFRNLKRLILLPLSYWSPLFVVRSPAYFPKESSCGVRTHSHKPDLTWHLLERARIALLFFWSTPLHFRSAFFLPIRNELLVNTIAIVGMENMKAVVVKIHSSD